MEPVNASAALAFGNLVHQALEAYYIPGRKRGVHPAKAFKKLFDAQPINGYQWDEDGTKIESRELGISMLQRYVEHYQKDSRYEMIAPEMQGAVDIKNSQGKYFSTLVFTFDGVAIDRQTGRIVLLEHKTAKSIKNVPINSQYGDQALTYVWGANLWLHDQGILKKKDTVSTVVFNFLRKAMPDIRPQNKQGQYLNKNGSVSLTQPPPFFSRQELVFGQNEFANLEKRLRNESWEMQQARQNKLPIHKNPTDDCSWDCSFRDVCELHEIGADFETILEYDFHKWEPYGTYQLRKEHK